MTKEQKDAINAMMYAFDKYGAKRLVSGFYMPDRINHPEHIVSFGEAYNICAKMVREEGEDENGK